MKIPSKGFICRGALAEKAEHHLGLWRAIDALSQLGHGGFHLRLAHAQLIRRRGWSCLADARDDRLGNGKKGGPLRGRQDLARWGIRKDSG